MGFKTPSRVLDLARRCRCPRWRALVSYGALASFVWPSLGPLPWIAEAAVHHQLRVDGLDKHAESEAAPPHHHDDEDALLPHHHEDASQIPGSPTHPIDHDCAQCQVLKDLAHCAFVESGVPEVPLPAGSPVQPDVLSESQQTPLIAALPPARGPPAPVSRQS